MPKRTKLILAGGLAIAAISSFYLFGGRTGGFVFTGQLSDIFREFFGQTEPDQVIWLDGRDDFSAKQIALENNPAGNSFSKKPAAPSFCSFSSAKKSVESNVVINEAAWMGNAANSSAEWVELKNIVGSPAAVGGYQLIDKANQIQFVFPENSVLPAGSFFVLARENQGTAADFFYSGILANSDEGLRLFDKDCNLLDSVLAEKEWPGGDNESKKTMERDAAGVWRTSSVAGGTPGRENSVLTPPPVLAEEAATASPAVIPPVQQPAEQSEPEPLLPPVESQPVQSSQPAIETVPPVQPPPPPVVLKPVLISEIMAGKEGETGYDFIELRNPNDQPFVLTGWSLRKKSSTGSESSLVAVSRLEGKNIPANGYFLLAKEEGYGGNPPPDVFWPKSYALAYANNAVVVYNPDGQKIEEVVWSEIPKDKSYERRSVDSADFFIQDVPNPQNSQ